MTDLDYAFLAKSLLDRSAIVLEPGKEYLVESRLLPVAKRHGFATIAEFVQRLRTPPQLNLMDDVVEAMVTTETLFFRDLVPFDILRTTVIPQFIRDRASQRRLTMWCGAASSGQEPYSIAMLLREHFPELLTWQITFLATDISHTMLQRCRDGRYSQMEVNRGVSPQLLAKYFVAEGGQWQIRADLRAMIDFRPLNLASSWPLLPPCDLVFLRNVMIYFDVPTKKAILQKIAKILKPDGYLILGGAETTYGLDDTFRRVDALRVGFFQKVG
jgi:chemotaxis protein methyltransferase CheR